MASESRFPLSPRKQGADDDRRPRTRVEDENALEKFYHMGEILGQGSFGVVKEATHRTTGKTFAIKAVSKDKPGSVAIQLLDREIEVLMRVNHAHIIHLEEVFETPKKVFMVLELCKGGELSKVWKEKGCFMEEECKIIMRSLAESVVYMHDNDMVHRDLKLENILLSTEDPSKEFNIKVTDFGLSHMKSLENSDSLMYSRCGTLYFMAPEVVRSKHEYSKLCDVWSMGVIMYALLSGCMPFNGESAAQVEDEILKGELTFKEIAWFNVSESAKDLIRGMLAVDPINRLTARQVLEDPWMPGGSSKQRFDPLKLLGDSPEIVRSQKTAASSPPPLVSVNSSPSRETPKLPTLMEDMSLGKTKPPTGSGADRPKKVGSSSSNEPHRRRSKSLGKSVSGIPSRTSEPGTGLRKPVSASTSRLAAGAPQPPKPNAGRHVSSTTKLSKPGSNHQASHGHL